MSALFEGYMSKHIFKYMYWDPAFVCLDGWRCCDSVLISERP